MMSADHPPRGATALKHLITVLAMWLLGAEIDANVKLFA